MNENIKKPSCMLKNPDCKVWSIERQVRFASGLLVLLGITLAYCLAPSFIWFAVMVALGMVLSALTDSCALGLLLMRMPWNKN